MNRRGPDVFTIKAPTFPEPPGDWYCDFCGDPKERKDIVAAPNKAAICGPCARRCSDAIARIAKPAAAIDPLVLGKAAGFSPPEMIFGESDSEHISVNRQTGEYSRHPKPGQASTMTVTYGQEGVPLGFSIGSISISFNKEEWQLLSRLLRMGEA